jgi:hypothetical protein
MKPGFFLLLMLAATGIGLAQPNKIARVRIVRGDVLLANERLGTVTDLTLLKTRLAERFRNGSREATVESDQAGTLSDLLRVLRTVRDLGAKPLSFRVTDSAGIFDVMIPVSADPDEDVANLRPNPLTLLVRLGADGRLTLNGDRQKSQHALLMRLKEIFRQRHKMKAYRPGSDEVEATLFLEPRAGVSLPTAVRLLRALHRAGANPLGLKIDDIGDGYIRSARAQPNKSLDASGGSVFRIMTGPAMLE